MLDQLTLLALAVALAAGMVTAFVTAVLAHSRQTAFFRFFMANILLFNLLILAGLVFRYLLAGSGIHHFFLLSVTIALAFLKTGWICVFIMMTRVMPGEPASARFTRRLMAAASTLLVVHLALLLAGNELLQAIGLYMLESVVLVAAAAACVQLLLRAGQSPSAIRRRSLYLFGSLHLTLFATIICTLGLTWTVHGSQTQAHVVFNSMLLILYNLLPLLWVFRFQPAGEASLSGEADRYGITPREREIVELIREGRTNQEIADRLFISLATVKDHNYNIFRKTGVRNRVELANLFR